MSGCGMLECTGCYGGGGDSNILVNGDNRSVLKKLEGMYASKARCIYIDPPYKNDETYSHYSDRASHDSWISDMRETLTGLYSFLSDDGSLWISIDDTEVHYLKVLCDELFGRKKFIATVIWQHRVSRENRKVFSNNHEYVLVYAKQPDLFKKRRNLLPLDPSVYARYKNPDRDPRGPWQSISLNAQAGHATKSQFYTLVAPNGTRHDPPTAGAGSTTRGA